MDLGHLPVLSGIAVFTQGNLQSEKITMFPHFRISGQKAQIFSQVSSLHTGIYLRIVVVVVVVVVSGIQPKKAQTPKA